ncbi:MAG: DUF2203 domain-containing protein [Thermoguttaceae bacterium]
MAARETRREKIFTASQANATLPLVRAIVSDLVSLAKEVTDRRQRLSLLTGGRPRQDKTKDLYQQELTQIEEELEKDGRQLEEYVRELRQIGVEPKSATEGLVDFPTLVDGRPAYLCWKLGEAEVLYWHELDAGFRGRQPLAVQAGTGSDFASEAES